MIPSGTVVFLFSDIEGSTARWDAYGEAMRDALRRHDSILRLEIEAQRGYVFKTMGDAFCAAFSTIDEAFAAAIAVQRRLEREDFTAVGGLRVRMAIHAGEADERSGDYFGTAVNRTARLLSAGHGGQILVSGVAADLAAPSLASTTTLRHLGTVPLKDLKHPERVYQTVAPGLRADFKPLRELKTPPNNLPRQTTSFIGRHDDLIQVGGMLRGHALVTIVGAGGVGKTRLALQAAADRLNDVRDGAWFVDLSSVAGAELVAGAILAALDAGGADDASPLDALIAHLGKRELLLVLDNCEHVVPEAARIVAAVLARCPHVAVLATSRAALDVGGEQVCRLSSLDLASAIGLFNDRALAANQAFRAEDNAAIVEDVCRRLDGIALGIELAAARVRTMPIEALSRHLELRMLSGGRDRLPRQQTMRALIDWSYDLLAPDEQAFLRRCAVFAGGFTLEAATGACSDETLDEWRVLDLLASLVGKSLLVLGGDAEGRYRLLEPIRQYAYEKLGEAGEMAGAQRRHAQAFALLAQAAYEEWDTNPAPDWLARLERELANVRAALRWSVDEGHDLELGAQLVSDSVPVFLRLSLLSEAIERCERVLNAEATLPAAGEARLRYGLSMLYNNQGASKNVLAQAQRAAELYRQAKDARGLTRALSQAARHQPDRSRGGDAQASADEALQLARQLGDRRLLAATLQRCALAFTQDDPDRVRALYAESVALFRSLGRDDETARALAWWAHWEGEAGEYRAAAERALEARQLAGDDLAMHLTIDIAGYYLALDDRTNAEPVAREALRLAVRAGHPIGTPFAICYIAAVANRRALSEAARLFGYADERFRALEWKLAPVDRAIEQNLRRTLEHGLGESQLALLLAEGAAWGEDYAIRRALTI